MVLELKTGFKIKILSSNDGGKRDQNTSQREMKKIGALNLGIHRNDWGHSQQPVDCNLDWGH